MSQPPPYRPPPPTPLPVTTPARSRRVTSQDPRDLIAANALVKLATTNTMNNNRNVSTPAATTNTDSRTASIAAEQLSKQIDNKANDAGKVPQQFARKKYTIKLGPPKKVAEQQSEEPVKTRDDSPRDPRELMAASALVGLATSGIVDADETSTPATKMSSVDENITATPNDHVDSPKQDSKTVVLKLGSSKQNEGKKEEPPPVKAGKDGPGEPRKPRAAKALRSNEASKLANEADLQNQYIALRLRRGEFKISDDALRLLGRSVTAFILDIVAKDKRQGCDNPIKKAQQRILAEKREADRRKKQQEWIKNNLPAMLKRLKDSIIEKKEPNESEELRLMREAMIRTTVSMYEDLFKTTTDLKDAVRRLEKEIASHEDIFGPGGDLETDYLFFVYGPLEKDGGDQEEGGVKTQQWVLLEDSGWDRRTRRKLAGEARLTPEFALKEGASVLEFEFGPTADAKKAVDSGEDKATMLEEQKTPQPPAVMSLHQHSDPMGTMQPVMQDDAWRARFEGLFGGKITATQRSPVTSKIVTAARKAIDNVKPEAPPADVQHTTAKKLDVPTAPTTTTTTTDEVPVTTLSGINISKTEKPDTTASKPQHQPPPEAKPIPSNPFYRPDMTLAIAAQNIVSYFREAVDWFNFWHISTSAAMLVDMSHKPTSTLSRIFWHLGWTAEFLRFGREGWDLRRLPENFFEDVLPLIMVTCGKLEKLGELKGCGRMMIGAWKDAEEVGEMLATVRNVRVRDSR